MVVLGWVFAAIIVGLGVVNGVYMLVSPKAWFRLPAWLRTSGSLTEEKYSHGWGGVQVRLAGALILATIGWVVRDWLR